jgi:site-specific recombinase XerD
MLDVSPPALLDQPETTSPTTGKSGFVLPAILQHADDRTVKRFLEFFAATIRNTNTRAAYYRAACKFFRFTDRYGIKELKQIEPLIVAAFVEEETKAHEPQTVKQELAAVRKLFDWLVVGQIVPFNPASSVRGPSYSTDQGKTPILTAPVARKLLDSIPASKPTGEPDLVGLRDRALIGLMIFSFARVSAVIGTKVKDYRQDGETYEITLHEKGGNHHRLPVHYNAERYINAYLKAAGIADQKDSPLFRSAVGRTGQLTDKPLHRNNVWGMIKRRAKAAGVATDISCHSFRGTGITVYLDSGGTIENAQKIAKHRSPRTTKLYDRRQKDVDLKEIERILL